MTERYQFPVQGTITDVFGMRVHPITGARRMHNGIDIAAPEGTPIRPLAPGRVASKGANLSESTGAGNWITVDHGEGLESSYWHMAAPSSLSVGAAVGYGSTLGGVGSTGAATGPHLHLEVYEHGSTVDPAPYVAAASATAGIGGTPINEGDEHMAFQIRIQEGGKLGRTLYIEPGYAAHVVHDDVVAANNYVGVPGGGTINQVSPADARRIVEVRGLNWSKVNALKAGQGVTREGVIVNAGAAVW